MPRWKSAAAYLALVAVTLLFAGQVSAQETILYNFIGGKVDGEEPMSTLIFDAAGNLYGSAFFGNKYNHGSVFELTPNVSGTWNENVLHVFNGLGDGHHP